MPECRIDYRPVAWITISGTPFRFSFPKPEDLLIPAPSVHPVTFFATEKEPGKILFPPEGVDRVKCKA